MYAPPPPPALRAAQGCLRWDPATRLNAFDALRHPWLREPEGASPAADLLVRLFDEACRATPPPLPPVRPASPAPCRCPLPPNARPSSPSPSPPIVRAEITSRVGGPRPSRR